MKASTCQSILPFTETNITFGLPSDIMSDNYEIWSDTVAKP